ncbi:MAG: class I SAM-dependent methyltransferase [Deltaproteobacteria bacterium]|nr:class I SAM-dependent methyltransferase [Deltaproteobacteria bacterium]
MRLPTAFVALALSPALLAGCKSEPKQAPPPAAVVQAAVATPVPHVAHGAGAAPIDCPLRKHGIDPGSLKPFEETEKYIAFLERADRASWQKPDEVVAALGLRGSETVADVGAGSGYFSFRFAKALPKGKVWAIDVDPEMVRHVHHRAAQEKVGNIEVVLAPPDDPSIPTKADLVFVCDVLHHVSAREAWLAKAFRETRPGTRFVLVEFKEGELPEGPPERMKISRAEVVRLMQEAGFVLQSERPELLPYQTFLVFARPDRK